MKTKKSASKRKKKKTERLTQMAACAGCAAKLSPALLKQAVFNLKQPPQPKLLVGYDKADDAGVYLLTPEVALVQTVDFFPPIVDDPIWYGRIAAANSLSDVYAMGGKPLTALNVFCFPEEIGSKVMEKILKGGLEKMIEGGCTLMGGHSVRDKEIKYGLSVTGTIDPRRILSNNLAQPGQTLVLTKRLGTGIITTAAKWSKCPSDVLDTAIEAMATLNDHACAAMLETKATACTDVTGFGFLGHLSEMARASGVRVRVHAKDVPHYDGLEKLVKDGYITRGNKTNREYAGRLKFQKTSPFLQSVFLDPQTSGGLLVSMPTEDVSGFINYLRGWGQEGWIVGEVMEHDQKGFIEVV